MSTSRLYIYSLLYISRIKADTKADIKAER